MNFWQPKPGETIKILPAARQTGKSTNFSTANNYVNWAAYMKNSHIDWTMEYEAEFSNQENAKIASLRCMVEKIKRNL